MVRVLEEFFYKLSKFARKHSLCLCFILHLVAVEHLTVASCLIALNWLHLGPQNSHNLRKVCSDWSLWDETINCAYLTCQVVYNLLYRVSRVLHQQWRRLLESDLCKTQSMSPWHIFASQISFRLSAVDCSGIPGQHDLKLGLHWE